ncbi:MAG TPA: hypothetical protein PLV68_15840 [Ilumatobacteraceae bacterium]|nr:hypothetical protein [Ilumatobacteraceae bacterium]
MATGRHRVLMAIAAPTIDAYARRHGWDVVLSSEVLAPERPPSWAKIRLLQDLMGHYEYVFWIDADAIVVDTRRNVLDEIDRAKQMWFASHPQQRDERAVVLNAGVILLRSGEFAEHLLRSTWEQTQYVDHNWWENAALLALLGYSLESPYARLRDSEFDDGIGALDLSWNSVPGYCESTAPAVNHHARADHDDFDRRVAAMAADLVSARNTFPSRLRRAAWRRAVARI